MIWTSPLNCTASHRTAFCYNRDLLHERVKATQFKNDIGLLLCFPKLFHLMQRQPPEMFYKIIVIKNFAKFTGKHLCRSLFKKHACQAVNFIRKKSIKKRVFCCDVFEILKTPFYIILLADCFCQWSVLIKQFIQFDIL